MLLIFEFVLKTQITTRFIQNFHWSYLILEEKVALAWARLQVLLLSYRTVERNFLCPFSIIKDCSANIFKVFC